MLDIDKSKPVQTRIYIKWHEETIIIDQIFRRIIKFDPSNHDEFKAKLATALQEVYGACLDISVASR
jgi:hypothetical protein